MVLEFVERMCACLTTSEHAPNETADGVLKFYHIQTGPPLRSCTVCGLLLDLDQVSAEPVIISVPSYSQHMTTTIVMHHEKMRTHSTSIVCDISS